MPSKFILVLNLILICIRLYDSEYVNVTQITNTAEIKNPFEPKDHIVNPHNFSYILNRGYTICYSSQSPIYLLIYVHSRPNEYQRRIVLRETWASRALFPDLRLVFMIGKISQDKVMKAIEYENEIYQDIVQEDFMDSYKNLTYKAIMALKWISIYCSNAKYILKVDNDIVVNTFKLIRFLKNRDKVRPDINRTILCLLWDRMHVDRNKKSKWYVSEDEYPLKVFRMYCSGSAYLFTTDLASRMFNASLYIPFFWIDDYYITGAVAKAVNVTYERLNSFYIISSQRAYATFMSHRDNNRIIFGHLPGSMNKMRAIWDQILVQENQTDPKYVQSYLSNWDHNMYGNVGGFLQKLNIFLKLLFG